MDVVGGTYPKCATARETEIGLRNHVLRDLGLRNACDWILAFSIWRSVMVAVAARKFFESNEINFELALDPQK